MTLNLSLSNEQISAIKTRAEFAEKTSEEFLLSTLLSLVNSYVEADFNAASQRLILASKSLPYEQRLAIIAQVENALTHA